MCIRDRITVGPPFFNQVNVPIGLLLLMLTGVGPLLAWRRTSRSNFIKYFSIPIELGLIAAIVLLLSGFRGYVVISLMLSVFVVVAIVTEFKRGVQARMNRFGESSFVAFRTMIGKNRSRYGGYFVHLGIVLMFIGFTGQAFNLKKEFGLGTVSYTHLRAHETDS